MTVSNFERIQKIERDVELKKEKAKKEAKEIVAQSQKDAQREFEKIIDKALQEKDTLIYQRLQKAKVYADEQREKSIKLAKATMEDAQLKKADALRLVVDLLSGK